MNLAGFAAAFLGHAVTAGLALVVLGLGVAFVRLWRGPTLADRVIALDLMTAAIVVFCGILAVGTGNPALLDIAISLALVSFLSVVALARYAERQARRSGRND